MKLKLVTIKRRKKIQSAPSQIQTHDLMFVSSTSLSIVLCCLFEIKTQLKVYEDKQACVILKNTNKLLCMFLNKKNNLKMNIYKNQKNVSVKEPKEF